MARVLDGLTDPVLWAILGWGAAVFAGPAVAILLATARCSRNRIQPPHRPIKSGCSS